jgi:5-methylcytosine-specific restriction endonuclease McrBC regulatory subunit McrC
LGFDYKFQKIMDINLLVQRLRHGDSYVVQDGDNDPYQVNNPPNHLMVKAANVILQQDNLLKQNQEVVLNLQRQLNELAQQYETLRTLHTTAQAS